MTKQIIHTRTYRKGPKKGQKYSAGNKLFRKPKPVSTGQLSRMQELMRMKRQELSEKETKKGLSREKILMFDIGPSCPICACPIKHFKIKKGIAYCTKCNFKRRLTFKDFQK